MQLAQLKVGTRLGIGFAIVLAFLAGTTALGIFYMTQIEKRLEQITHVNNQQIGLANAMRVSFLQRMISVRNLALVTDLNDAKQEVARMDKQKQAYETHKKQLGAMLGGASAFHAETSKAYSEINANEAAALPLIAKAVELGLANRQSEAVDLLLKEIRPVNVKWLTSLSDLISITEKRNEQAAFDAKAAYGTALTLMYALGACALLVGIAAAFVITRSLTRQFGGEPGYAAEIVQQIAGGNLAIDVNLKPSDRSSLLYAMKEMRDSLVKIVGDVRGGTDTIATASAQIASGNMDLSSRTEQQASSLEETASSMEELTSTVKQNADNARQANQLAVSASSVAVKGGEVVAQVVTTMGSINESARKIGDIIGVIDGIAFQTNILALNAAVEAARAGEQGRGFAVVASEVRNLAQRSAAAAKEIKTLIGDSVEKVDAGSTMDEIVSSVKRVTDIMAEIMAASQEQSAGIEQVNQAIGQMDQVTQQNAALVEEAAAAAHSMQEQAASLTQVVSVFRLDSRMTSSSAAELRAVPVKKEAQASSFALPLDDKSRATRARQPIAGKQGSASKRPPVAATSKGDWEEF